MILTLAVGLGASFGAVLRYLVDQYVSRWRATEFPAGTWVINMTGAFVLGLLTGLAAHHGLSPDVVAVAGTGVCGGYTTFSTFSFETMRLLEDGAGVAGVANMVGSIALGLLAAAAGLGVGLL